MSEAHLFVIGILLAWMAGIRVYLTVFGLGVAGALGWLDLPPALQVTESWWVLGTSGALAVTEFFADKIPGVDSGWDLLQTLLRVPAGAFLAAAALSPDGQLGAGMLATGRISGRCDAVAGWPTQRHGTGSRWHHRPDQPCHEEWFARLDEYLARAGEQLDRLDHRGRTRHQRHGPGVRQPRVGPGGGGRRQRGRGPAGMVDVAQALQGRAQPAATARQDAIAGGMTLV